MLGRKSGFQSHVKFLLPTVTFVHCLKYRFALCAKVLPHEIIKIVDFIKTTALSTRLFADLGSVYKISPLSHRASLTLLKIDDKASLRNKA